jgi:ABC-2 type transport system ATP-binding protein
VSNTATEVRVAREQNHGKHTVVETRGLTKRYGSLAALDHCSFAIAEREIYGLLGPNGAGKTTLLRLLLGFLRPTSGTARLHGFDCARESLAIRKLTAYLPGEARLFRGLRGRDVLQFFAELRGVGPERSFLVAERLELNLASRVGMMSTGMRQKLAVATTFAAKVPLIVLDEPTSNLDPTARAVVLDLVREARASGSTILFSSHVLAEVEEVCDRVAILRAGQVVHVQVMNELRQQHRIVARIRGHLPLPPEELHSLIEIQPNSDGHVAIHALGELAPVLGWLGTLPLHEVRIDPIGLRTVYDRFHKDSRTPRIPLDQAGES